MKVQLKEIKNIRNLVWILFWLTIAVELASIIPVISASFLSGLSDSENSYIFHYQLAHALLFLIPFALTITMLYRVKKAGERLLLENELEDEVDITDFLKSIRNYLWINIISILFSLIVGKLLSLLFLGVQLFKF